jgi:hypothetical protein
MPSARGDTLAAMHEGDREETGEDGAANAVETADTGTAGGEDRVARGTDLDGAASADADGAASAAGGTGADEGTESDGAAGADAGTESDGAARADAGTESDGAAGEGADEDAESDAGEDEGSGEDGAPEDVSRDLFLVWRYPRVGLRNPQRMTNAVWTWLARQRELSAWSANAKFSGPSSMLVGPGWCASRFGRTDTPLPDGRVVAIGGEHEDYYDPDFYIYNDVIVTLPTGELEIYGYPHEAFPPTDFHSATLVGDRVIVIGCLGFAWQRTPGHTPVFALDTRSFEMSRVAATGEAPGWISEHTAELAADGATITVRRGQRCVVIEGERELVDNIDEWSLDLERGLWTRLTDRRWPQFELARADGKCNELFWIDNGLFHVDRDTPWDREQMAGLVERLGRTPDFALFAERYAPPMAHTKLTADDDEWNEKRIVVEGVTVRFREESSAVRVMFEGTLPEATVAAIVEDARRKLAEIELQPYVARRLASG